MKKVITEEKILEYVCKNINVSLDDIKNHFGISVSTLHRLVNKLKNLFITVSDNRVLYIPFSYFENKDTETEKIKNKIAYNAVDIIKDGEVICLAGSSSTVSLMLPFILMRKKDVSVITNTVPVLRCYMSLYDIAIKNNITLLTIGGTVPANVMSFGGEYADNIISHFNINKIFISTQGVNSLGLYVDTPLETYAEKTFLSVSSEKYILADSAKFKSKRLFRWGEWKEFDGIITDREEKFVNIDGFKHIVAKNDIVIPPIFE